MKRWSICQFRFCLPPLPQRAKYSSSVRVERASAGDAPKFVLGPFPSASGRLDCTLTRLAKPIAALNSLQLFFQLRGKQQQIMHVVQRVFQHPWRQRSQRPICFLRMFVKINTEETFHQCTQTEFADPKQSRGNDCVENSARGEIQSASKHPQIVICGMQNNFSRLQDVTQRFQIEIAQRIDNEIVLSTNRQPERSRRTPRNYL